MPGSIVLEVIYWIKTGFLLGTKRKSIPKIQGWINHLVEFLFLGSSNIEGQLPFSLTSVMRP